MSGEVLRAGAISFEPAASDNGAGKAAATELAALRAILDDLDYGIVVLDAARRVHFVNRAFRRFWNVPDDIADGRPSFIKLMYHGRGTAAYAVAPHRLGEYVTRQLEAIRTGSERPLNIRLISGEVIRFRCKPLPDGGRLLTYGHVSDLVREAEALERLASVDAMTGLNNRRHFLELAEIEWSRFRRYGHPLALIMLDIDRFKSVNDSYGHDAGDQVIMAVAEILQKYKRVSDIAGRLGGEEFAVLLPEATLEAAAAAGERLRKLITERVIAAAGARIPVTVSVGVAAGGDGVRSIDALIKAADVALYEAKRAGRNRVCRFCPAAGASGTGDQGAAATSSALPASKRRESTLR